MRAVIRCKSDVSRAELQGILEDKKWWPVFEQSDQKVASQRDRLLDLVAPDDQEVTRSTLWFTVHGYPHCKTWGIVNQPAPGFLEFRLRHESAADLMKASEALISGLGSDDAKRRFQFTDIIEVLEASSQQHAFFGIPLPPTVWGKWKQATEERRPEWRIAKWTFAGTILLTACTIPPFAKTMKGTVDPLWVDWAVDFLGRLATSALITSAVSYLTVLVHYSSLRGTVQWLLHQRDVGIMAR